MAKPRSASRSWRRPEPGPDAGPDVEGVEPAPCGPGGSVGLTDGGVVLTGGGAGPVGGAAGSEAKGEDTAAEDTFGASDAAGPVRTESRGLGHQRQGCVRRLWCPFRLNAHDLLGFFDSGLPTAAGWL